MKEEKHMGRKSWRVAAATLAVVLVTLAGCEGQNNNRNTGRTGQNPSQGQTQGGQGQGGQGQTGGGSQGGM